MLFWGKKYKGVESYTRPVFSLQVPSPSVVTISLAGLDPNMAFDVMIQHYDALSSTFGQNRSKKIRQLSRCK